MPEKLYVSVKAIIINSKNQILILKTRINDSGWWWSIPGGRINKGENDLKQTLKRELKEEIGTDELEIDALIGNKITNKSEIGPRIALYFRVFAPENFIPKLSEEHVDFKWVDISKVSDLKNGDEKRSDVFEILENLNFDLKQK